MTPEPCDHKHFIRDFPRIKREIAGALTAMFSRKNLCQPPKEKGNSTTEDSAHDDSDQLRSD